MLERKSVYAEIVNMALEAKWEAGFISVADMVLQLNRKGLCRADGELYKAGRGSYRTVACAYAWAKRNGDQDAAEAVAEMFVTPDGRRAWDQERRRVV